MPESKLGIWHNSDSAWTFQKARWHGILECQLDLLLQILSYPSLVEITQSQVHLRFRQLDQIVQKECILLGNLGLPQGDLMLHVDIFQIRI